MTEGTELARLRQVLQAPSSIGGYGLAPKAVDRAYASVRDIWSHMPDEQSAGSVTGLALGYVQSGKTISFTSLAALAADEGCSIVIAFLGSTTLLYEQNADRLLSDLGLDDRHDYRWAHFAVPTAGVGDVGALAASVGKHLERGRTLLFTVLKNYNRIAALEAILSEAELGHASTALIIDDEADQISLNARVNEGEMSTTYERILDLRKRLPAHLYVQYTATPYAPLLIEARDVLAPQFVVELVPGEGYTGGETFFVERRDLVLRKIEEHEAEDPEPTAVPRGLKQALALFIVGCVLSRTHGAPSGPPRSMLVHVSHLTDVHRHWGHLVEIQLDAWRSRSRRGPEDPGWASLSSDLSPAYDDLVAGGVPPLDGWLDLVRDVLLDTDVHIVNSTSDVDSVPWRNNPFHILIGGNKLDRGFTVRGLTVTYLIRRAVGGNVDTVEQRARSFGYKANILEYCRVLASRDVLAALTAIVHTEEDLRRRLEEWQLEGRPLAAFAEEVGLVIPDRMDATRRTVVSPSSASLAGWHVLGRPSLEGGDITANSELVSTLGIFNHDRVAFGAVLAHHHVELPLGAVLEEVLKPWRGVASPGWRHELITSGVRRLIDRLPDLPCDVLGVRRPDGTPRRRGWVEPRGVTNLMQGRDAGTGYPGDRYLSIDGTGEAPDRPQLQVHHVSIDGTGKVLHTLALHLPDDAGQVVTRRPAA